MRTIADFKHYLIDIEGVLVRDKRYEPVAGSVEWLNGLAEQGIAWCLVSNNTTHRPDELVADLRRVGFEVEPRRLLGVLELAVDLLRERNWTRVLWLGEPRLADFWREAGMTLVAEEPCDVVLLGVNSGLRTADLDGALRSLIDHGARLVALHRNHFWLDAEGRRRLGPGAWCAALEPALTAGRTICLGKPAERIYSESLKRVGATAAQSLFISDDPIADLVTARRLGMGTAFVLSGKYPDHGVLGSLDQEDWPEIICSRPAALTE